MAYILVTHVSPDVDAISSIIALKEWLRRSYRGIIKIVFIPQGTTYKDIKVNSRNLFEKIGSDRVYHVDVGRGRLDNHNPFWRGKANSSLEALSLTLNFKLNMPHWLDIVRYVSLADQGELKGGLNLQQAIIGWKRKKYNDLGLYKAAKPVIEAFLANGRIGVSAQKIKRTNGNLLPIKSLDEEDYVRVQKLADGTKITFAVCDEDLAGKVRGRFNKSDVLIIYSRDTGYIKIGSQSTTDLIKAGIVQMVRQAEAAKRSLTLTVEELNQEGDVPGMGWFAFVPNSKDRCGALLHGSPKAEMTADMKTLLSMDEIVSAVLEAFTEPVKV